MHKELMISKKYLFILYTAIMVLIISSRIAGAVPVKMTGWSVVPDVSQGQVVQSKDKTVLRVTGTGSDDQRWTSPVMKFKPGGEYLLRFTSQSTGMSGNLPCGVAGVNRDFVPTSQPTINSFAYGSQIDVGS